MNTENHIIDLSTYNREDSPFPGRGRNVRASGDDLKSFGSSPGSN